MSDVEDLHQPLKRKQYSGVGWGAFGRSEEIVQDARLNQQLNQHRGPASTDALDEASQL